MKNCPFCHSDELQVVLVEYHHYAVECTKCDARGPIHSSKEDAIDGWNERQPQ